MRARAVTMSATARSPIVHCAAKPGTGAVTLLADMVSVAASNTKSYSLDLPAATIAKPSVSAQVTRPISRLGWSPSTGVTTRPRALRLAGKPGADHAVDLLGDQHQVAAGLHRHARMTGAGLGMARCLHDHIDGQLDDGREIACGDGTAGVPGRLRLGRRPAHRDLARIEARGSQGDGSRLRVDVHRHARAHTRHLAPLGQEAAAEAAGADEAGLDGSSGRAEVAMVVHGAMRSLQTSFAEFVIFSCSKLVQSA